MRKILLLILFGILFSSFVYGYNASGDIYNLQIEMSPIATNGDDGDTFNVSAAGSLSSNITDSSIYQFSYLGANGNINLSSINLTSPPNESQTSQTIDINFDWNTQDYTGFSDCYYLLNFDNNISFPCNSSNLTMTGVNYGAWNNVTLFINDSGGIFSKSYKFWVNASATGTADSGGGGGGSTTILKDLKEESSTVQQIIDTSGDTIKGIKPYISYLIDQIGTFVLDILGFEKTSGKNFVAGITVIGIILIFISAAYEGKAKKNILRTLMGLDKKERKNLANIKSGKVWFCDECEEENPSRRSTCKYCKAPKKEGWSF